MWGAWPKSNSSSVLRRDLRREERLEIADRRLPLAHGLLGQRHKLAGHRRQV
jgi:hypothetical protein